MRSKSLDFSYHHQHKSDLSLLWNKDFKEIHAFQISAVKHIQNTNNHRSTPAQRNLKLGPAPKNLYSLVIWMGNGFGNHYSKDPWALFQFQQMWFSKSNEGKFHHWDAKCLTELQDQDLNLACAFLLPVRQHSSSFSEKWGQIVPVTLGLLHILQHLA